MFNPSLMSTALNPLMAPPPAAPTPAPHTPEPGAFGRELKRAADAAQSEPKPESPDSATPEDETSTAPADKARAERRPAAPTHPRPAKAGAAADKTDAVADSTAASRPDESTSTDPLHAEDAERDGVADLSAWLAQAQLAGRAEHTQEQGPALPTQQPTQADPLATAATVITPGLATAALAAKSDAGSALPAAATQAGAPGAATTDLQAHAQPAAGAAVAAATGVVAPPEPAVSSASASTASLAATFAALLAESKPGAGRPEAAPVEATLGTAAATGAAAPAPTSTVDSAAVRTVAEDSLTPTVGSREFAQALGARVAHFARNGIEHARLNINPAELGPIALQLALDGTQLRVDMAAEVAATRQMLEQSLPTLASTLRDAGLTLSGGGVFQQARDGNAAPGSGQGRATTGSPADAPDDRLEPMPTARSSRLTGLVDTYA